MKTVLLIIALAVATTGPAWGQTPTPKPEDEAIKKLVTQLQKEFSGSNEELKAAANEVARPLIASLRHGLGIARADQRRRRMEMSRVKLVQMEEDAAEERRRLFEQMHEELAVIDKQFAGTDSKLCEQQQVHVVRAFSTRIEVLAQREQRCRDKVEETSAQLLALRNESAMRERDRWLEEKAAELAVDRYPIPRLAWVRDVGGIQNQGPDQAPPNASEQTLQDLLVGLKQLDNRP